MEFHPHNLALYSRDLCLCLQNVRNGVSPYCEIGMMLELGPIMWYAVVSTTLSEHLWFLSLERSSVLGIRRLEIDIGGLEKTGWLE